MNYPYGPPGYPVYGYPAPPKAGGGTAITGGILALLQGLLWSAAAVGGAFGTRSDVRSGAGHLVIDFVLLILLGVVAALFLSGSVLLLARRGVGRVLVIMAAVLVMLGLAGWAVFVAATEPFEKSDVAFMAVFLTIGFTFHVITLCLAAARSTGRWIAARQQLQYPYY
ncbi:hypothetical protein [Nocardia transvalensis]|uniref:hypothetical protein n=1 Tax=Nocardia transvalensis TaxID=37333 RepID=UPI0018938963|nr:hypothetical protein [Nocardia transvalensis]MBF6328595.1 hypothetical protein [Nocardia transvalensis]